MEPLPTVSKTNSLFYKNQLYKNAQAENCTCKNKEQDKTEQTRGSCQTNSSILLGQNAQIKLMMLYKQNRVSFTFKPEKMIISSSASQIWYI